MRKLSAAMICVGLFFGVLLTAPAPAHADPGVVTMDLYGSSAGGWGLLSSSESNPGPHISVHQGDTVTITLHSTDGFPHQFFVDYNRNDVIDADEPASGSFSTTTTAPTMRRVLSAPLVVVPPGDPLACTTKSPFIVIGWNRQ